MRPRPRHVHARRRNPQQRTQRRGRVPQLPRRGGRPRPQVQAPRRLRRHSPQAGKELLRTVRGRLGSASRRAQAPARRLPIMRLLLIIFTTCAVFALAMPSASSGPASPRRPFRAMRARASCDACTTPASARTGRWRTRSASRKRGRRALERSSAAGQTSPRPLGSGVSG